MNPFRLAFIFLLACILISGAWSQTDEASDKPKSQPPKTDAQKYAAALNQFLMDVNKQVGLKIKAEQDFYKTTSEIYMNHYKEDMLGSLQLDRIEGATALADRMLTSRGLSGSIALQKSMRDQATLEVAAMRKMLANERDIENSYLSSVAQLDSELARIKSLSDALTDLSRPKGTKQSLQEMVEYATEIKDAYITAQCADIDAEVKDLTQRKASVKSADKGKSLDSQITRLNQFKTDNCASKQDSGTKKP
jgi:hypothetical protein